jgi:Flp pilus assembly protein TadG
VEIQTPRSSIDAIAATALRRPFQSIRPRRHTHRRGLAVSELAICLPILVLIVFGSLQMCNVIYLKHALVTAAYEGSLEMAKSTTTNDNVTARIQQVLEARRINNAEIEILPVGTNVAATPHGATLTIHLTANTASNLSVTGFVTFPVTMEHTLVCSR